MKKLSISFILLLISFKAVAAFDDYAEKQFSLGVGTYASVIGFDDPSIENIEYSGIAFTLGYAATDSILLRGTYFSTENNDFADQTSKGYDLLAYLGTGMATPGFKAYIGGGVFSDKQELTLFGTTASKKFNGLQFSGGIGYNWTDVSLDFILNVRDPSEYEDAVNTISVTQQELVVVSGSLLLSYRF